MDPARLVTTRSSNSYQRSLNDLHARLAQHESHHKFALACLQENVVPAGLRLRSSPQVPKPVDDVHLTTLHEKWNAALQGTSVRLLKLLKEYHKNTLDAIRERISTFKEL